jgi:hypothetical protein
MFRLTFHQIIILLLIFGISSCSHVNDKLKLAEKLMETAPDSSLHILRSIHSQNFMSSSHRAFYSLLMSQALDKKDIIVKSDSLIS